jgi:hypothetical protein
MWDGAHLWLCPAYTNQAACPKGTAESIMIKVVTPRQGTHDLRTRCSTRQGDFSPVSDTGKETESSNPANGAEPWTKPALLSILLSEPYTCFTCWDSIIRNVLLVKHWFPSLDLVGEKAFWELPEEHTTKRLSYQTAVQEAWVTIQRCLWGSAYPTPTPTKEAPLFSVLG